MKKSIAAFLTILFCTFSSQAAPIQYAGNGHWYEVILGNFTWSQALANAAAKKYSGEHGYLATVTSAGENNFIASLAPQATLWLGGSDNGAPVNHWTWRAGPEAGQAFTYSNWSPGEPNNLGIPDDCVECGAEDYLTLNWPSFGVWNDLSQTIATVPVNGFVVEYADPVPSGNVPEPMSIILLGTGFIGLAVIRQGKRSSRT